MLAARSTTPGCASKIAALHFRRLCLRFCAAFPLIYRGDPAENDCLFKPLGRSAPAGAA